MIEAYVQTLSNAISASPITSTFNVTLDKRTPQVGLIRGEVHFVDGSRLYFRELVEAQANTTVCRMYSYHYQNANTALIFRYDDTPHHPNLRTFPHHKHDSHESNVIAVMPPTLIDVLREIETLYPLMEDA
ncbi:MAG TPA: DUF6516 family protein [Anaerolineae bacterium]|nr:DUF6516 family protein [Anaerolineae bacterium]HQI87153.1 DUF6516 family protein [Anaerolineae bacterium]